MLSGNSKNTEDTVCLFLDLLGWKLAVDRDKAAEFSHQFSALGIVGDLKNSLEGFATLPKNYQTLFNISSIQVQCRYLNLRG